MLDYHTITLVSATYSCPWCGRVSYNPNDLAQRYCGACHTWADDFWHSAKPVHPQVFPSPQVPQGTTQLRVHDS
jgi:hypothetical protein